MQPVLIRVETHVRPNGTDEGALKSRGEAPAVSITKMFTNVQGGFEVGRDLIEVWAAMVSKGAPPQFADEGVLKLAVEDGISRGAVADFAGSND